MHELPENLVTQDAPVALAARQPGSEGLADGRETHATHRRCGAEATAGPQDSIRHRLRARFVRAVRRAVQELQAGPLREVHRRTAIARIAEERLLIADDDARTSQRAIAQDCGLSSGRVCDYEQRVLGRVRRLMNDDPQIRLLVHFARTHARGFEAVLEPEQLHEIEQADLCDFRRRFAALPRSGRADWLYGLIEASGRDIGEVAVSLYKLAYTFRVPTVPRVEFKCG